MAKLQVSRVERCKTGSARTPPRLDRRQRGEDLLPASRRRTGTGADAVCARRIEQMAVRVHEPPSAVDLLDPEEACGCSLGGEVPTVLVIAESDRLDRGFLPVPGLLEILQARGLAGPSRRDPLAELIDHHLGVEDRVTRILLGKSDGADLKHRPAYGPLHLYADGRHLADGRPSAEVDVDPIGVPVLVVGCSQVKPLARRPSEELERDSGPYPGVLERLDTLGHLGLWRDDLELESLRGRRPHLEHQEVVLSPVRRQAGRKV